MASSVSEREDVVNRMTRLAVLLVVIVAVGVGYPLMRPRLTHQADLYDDDPDLHRRKLQPAV